MRYDNIGPTYPNLVHVAEVMFVLDQLPTAAERAARDAGECEAAIEKVRVSIPPDLRPDNDR